MVCNAPESGERHLPTYLRLAFVEKCCVYQPLAQRQDTLDCVHDEKQPKKKKKNFF